MAFILPNFHSLKIAHLVQSKKLPHLAYLKYVLGRACLCSDATELLRVGDEASEYLHVMNLHDRAVKCELKHNVTRPLEKTN